MKIKSRRINIFIAILIVLFGIVLIVNLPIAMIAKKLLLSIDNQYDSYHQALITAIEDYTKSTIIFMLFIWLFFHIYKHYKSRINSFLKQHFLIIKGFGILYVAILAIVPVLKDSLNAYVTLSPYHHIFIYLVIIIVFFCVFISSFEEDMMNKKFQIIELLVCFFLCLMGLGLFFLLMDAPN